MSGISVTPQVRRRVLNAVFDDRFGGPQKRVVMVGQRLATYGIETVLALPEGEGNAQMLAESAGIRVRRTAMTRIPSPHDVMRVLRWVVNFPGDVARFRQLFRQERPDVVHVNGAFFLAPGLAARLAGLPLVWHLNDTIVPAPLARLLGGVVYRLADRVVVAAEAVASHYGVDRAPHDVLYAPVDVDRYAKSAAERSPDGSWRVGLVGNWNPLKGHRYFLAAVASARRDIEGLRAVLAGSRLGTHANYALEIDRYVEECGLGGVVDERGFVPDIENLLPELDALVLSSTTEACPMVVLEGMAAGLPVVATDVGGVRELLLGDPAAPAGIVVPSRSPGAIADALVALYRDPVRARWMGRNGRERARRLYSVETIASQHRDIYSALLPAETHRHAYV